MASSLKLNDILGKNSGNYQGKVLLMDDQENVRKIGVRMLTYLGYEVELAEDGDRAIDLYKRAMKSGKNFDFVLLDIVIPNGMGGKETIQKLREIDPEIKAIVSSAYSDEPIMSDYRRYGFIGMIAKPYDIWQLSDVLNAVVKVPGK